MWVDVCKASLANFQSTYPFPEDRPFLEPGNNAKGSSNWAKAHSLSGQFTFACLVQEMVGTEGESTQALS